ncbi:transmembrane protein 151B-like [Anabrus simplex]|uniref:transmembrane protein 151B-like n=1 Tax=Anabrus simplex TaxID=316456 RepID=UPI0035A2B45E
MLLGVAKPLTSELRTTEQSGLNERAGDPEAKQRPVQQTLCGTLQRDTNWKCLILTLLIYGCLGAVTWCRLTEVTKVIINFSLYPIRSTRQMSPCDDGYIYIPVAFMAMLYLVYLVECWHCTARIEMGHKVDTASVLEKVRQMREAQPIVWWKAVCYHYVRRKRQVTRYRSGDSYTTTQVYYERVNSHAAGSCFVFAYCGMKDISRELLLDKRGPITKIRFSKGFAFANVEAAADFEEQRARFFGEYERYDDYMEMREGLDLSNVTNFKEYVVAYPDPDRMPWYSSPAVFWLCSFLLLSWPLRMVIEYNTAYVHYQVTKLFGVNYEVNSTTPTSTNQPISSTPGMCHHTSRGQLSHGSTIDSGDLEWCIRDNYAIVPSYSEALLMEDRPSTAAATTETAAVHQQQQPRMPIAYSSYSIRGLSNNNNITSEEPPQPSVSGQPRRSWGGIFNSGSRSSLSRMSRSSTHNRLVLYYPSPLVERCPEDPFQGRTITTPTEDPPPYEDALNLPVLSRLRRSLTERGDICRRREQRRSCGQVVVAESAQLRLQSAAAAATSGTGGRGRALITMETSL